MVCRHFRAVFAIDIKQHVDRRLIGRPGASGADARQHLRQRGAQDCQPARANSRDSVCVLLVQGRFQLLERLYVKRLMQALGQVGPTPGMVQKTSRGSAEPRSRSR